MKYSLTSSQCKKSTPEMNNAGLGVGVEERHRCSVAKGEGKRKCMNALTLLCHSAHFQRRIKVNLIQTVFSIPPCASCMEI